MLAKSRRGPAANMQNPSDFVAIDFVGWAPGALHYTKNTLDDERPSRTIYHVAVEAREAEALEVRSTEAASCAFRTWNSGITKCWPQPNLKVGQRRNR